MHHEVAAGVAPHGKAAGCREDGSRRGSEGYRAKQPRDHNTSMSTQEEPGKAAVGGATIAEQSRNPDAALRHHSGLPAVRGPDSLGV